MSENLKSKRHLLKFYLSLYGCSLFFITVGFLMFKIANDELKEHASIIPEEFFIGIVFLFIAIYSIVIYYKRCPIIKIDKTKIEFNNQSFLLSDIKSLKLTGTRNFKYFLMNFPMEGIVITFKNGLKQEFFDDFYSNSAQIKEVLNKFTTKNIVPKKNDILHIKYSKKQFKDPQLLSFHGIILWGFFPFFIFIVLKDTTQFDLSSLYFFIPFFTFWFIIHSYLMNYFILDGNKLTVKNHNFFWKNIDYSINGIKEIKYESKGRMPNCLRITMDNFESKLYPAATLRRKTWLELKKQLEKNNIKVDDTCIE